MSTNDAPSARARRPAVRSALVPLVGVLVAACGFGPAEPAVGVEAWVWHYDDADLTYSLSKQPIRNFDSFRELRSPVVDFRRGSRMVTDLSADGANVYADRGSPFALDYDLDSNGTVVAADLDSLQALSLYHSFDRIAERLAAQGFVPARPVDVLFLPRIDNILAGDQRFQITDNAAYVPLLRAFLIVPALVLSDLPMLLNHGVVAHEFGHAVIHERMFGDVTTVPFADDGSAEAQALAKHLSSMHEGVADLIGYVMTADSNFIRPTIDIDRDLAKPRDLTEEDLEEIEAVSDGSLESLLSGFDPHFYGSTMARAVFEAWPRTDGAIDAAGRERMLGVVLEALRRLTDGDDEFAPGKFTLASFPNEVAGLLDDAERPAACAVFRQRFAPLRTRLANCRTP